jgi:hypothetical protein
MELKEMIAELGRHADGRVSVHCITAAAEALSLVAWAEERKAEVDFSHGKWTCWTYGERTGDTRYYDSDTLLGAIRAAKEAYEQSR